MSMRLRSRDRLMLFVCFYFLYAATSPGDLIADSQIRWTVAERIVDTGWVSVEPGTAEFAAAGRGGELYTIWPPGQSLVLVPFVVVGRLVAAITTSSGAGPDVYGQFLASLLLFPACGAWCLVLVYGIARDVTEDVWTARWTALSVGLASMHWQHTVNTGEESLAALCMLGVLKAALQAGRRPAWRYPLLACAAAGLGLWFRLSSAVVSATLLAVACIHDVMPQCGAQSRGRRACKWLVAGAAGLLPFIAAYGAYNFARFGSVWETGYGPAVRPRLGVGLFDTPLLEGLGGMLFSPGKGVFVFNPILLLAMGGVAMWWRSNRRLACMLMLTFAASVLFHSRYTTWAGDITWGPRYLASQMGIWMLGVIPVLRRPKLKPLFGALFTISVLIQISSVVYNYGLEFFQDGRHGLVPDYVWRPAESQLLCRFRNIALHMIGRPIHESIPPDVVRPELHQRPTKPEQVQMMHVVNWFPFKAYAHVRSRVLFVCLLILWLILIVALTVTVLWWRRMLRSSGPAARQGA